MTEPDRIPVLVFDDGSPVANVAFTRALEVASHIVLAVSTGSASTDHHLARAARAGVPVEVVDLDPATGIRHALAICGEREIYSAYVPSVDVHPGEQLRKIIQAAARAETVGLPVLAVTIVHPDAPTSGPVVEVDPPHTDAGFTSLYAAGLAGTSRCPLHVVRLDGDRDAADQRASDALHEARALITHDEIAVYEQHGEGDGIDAAVASSAGARAVVVGFGGVTIRGRKPTHPDELPDSVLGLPDGRLAHVLLQQISTDLVVVCDQVELRRGRVASSAAIGAAVAAVTAGGVIAGAVGLGAVVAAIGVAAAGSMATGSTPSDGEAPDTD